MSSDQEQRQEDPKPHLKNNPHGDFKEAEASREPFDRSVQWRMTQAPNPNWKPGDGANDGGACLKKEHIAIDPYEDGRPARFNYKLLISAIIPRPVGFISTRSKDGSSTNLAPFSYMQVINHDPPIFIVGHAGGLEQAKDSLRNLVDSGECTINIISEHYVEAANATSVNAPYGISEWALTGLTPAECKQVKASRVKEAVFSVEGKLMETKEFESRATPGKKTGVLAIIEGVQFWAREDAINEDKNLIDPAILRPVARLGGITYARTLEGMELPRPDWEEYKNEAEARGIVKPKADGQ
ncbi:related to conserved domain typically associated with flavo oxygenases, DIM6 NTAB family [Lecanosticta acicola]|uniref:Related to conserved domain typically associated with flavo oxygenases, DIM6 NTAB family n=1 Tax=Lecanosticta acicola TaxID=111012 RepID=A0AAI9E820_9PEZI|nr:related to conserved domain typically associated with flavo oxygenases, DIM6 NTAB family [Lecanosticta acicola]